MCFLLAVLFGEPLDEGDDLLGEAGGVTVGADDEGREDDEDEDRAEFAGLDDDEFDEFDLERSGVWSGVWSGG